jgi:hypothetical protein
MAGWDVTTDFAAFAHELDRSSDDIKREVGTLIPSAARLMVGILQARYPRGKTGSLDDDTRIRSLPGTDPLLPVERVIGAPHAILWQDGSVERVNYTRNNARRGRMPAAAPKFFERTAVQTRAAMIQRAQSVLDRPRQIGSVRSPGRLL